MAGAGTFHAACEFRALPVRARTYAEEPDPCQEIYMKRLALIAAVLAVAACAKSENVNKDTTTPATAPAPAPAATDTAAKMDTTHKMDTTTKKP